MLHLIKQLVFLGAVGQEKKGRTLRTKTRVVQETEMIRRVGNAIETRTVGTGEIKTKTGEKRTLRVTRTENASAIGIRDAVATKKVTNAAKIRNT